MTAEATKGRQRRNAKFKYRHTRIRVNPTRESARLGSRQPPFPFAEGTMLATHEWVVSTEGAYGIEHQFSTLDSRRFLHSSFYHVSRRVHAPIVEYSSRLFSARKSLISQPLSQRQFPPLRLLEIFLASILFPFFWVFFFFSCSIYTK